MITHFMFLQTGLAPSGHTIGVAGETEHPRQGNPKAFRVVTYVDTYSDGVVPHFVLAHFEVDVIDELGSPLKEDVETAIGLCEMRFRGKE